MRTRFAMAALALVMTGGIASAQKQKKIPVAPDVGPKEQDIEIGRKAAQQVEQQMYVVPNRELTDYVNRIGKKLISTGMLDRDFPYSFKVVQEKSLNAFALPGGPMFVHTGLIAAAESESQLAGVLAHELSHVSLRHAMANSGKQQTAAGIGQIAGAILGGLIGGGLGQIAQAGAAIAGQGFAMKYSRGAEAEADLLGAYTMAKAGYNPLDLGRFFEKLEAEAGGDPGKVAEFFSSHPNPGNRTKMIAEQMPYMPQGPYDTRVGSLDSMRRIVASLPPAPKSKGAQAATLPAGGPMPASFPTSRNMKSLSTQSFSISYPENWQPVRSRQGGLTIAPEGGLVENGIGAGMLMSGFTPQRARDLRGATEELIQSFVQNGQMTVTQQVQQIEVDGKPAMIAHLRGPSPFQNQREKDVLITLPLQGQMLFMVFAAPESRFAQLEPAFKEMVRSFRTGSAR